jgi:serine/threonine protein kinase
MVTRLRTPFSSLSAGNFLSRGSGGQVFAVSQNVVFKCPTYFDDPAPSQADEMQESIKKIENEKAVYGILMEHRHPHIVYGILCIPQGIFMQRLEMTLESRIAESPTRAISPSTQERWIQQLTSAVAWLEHLGYVHGDLRPANILLDSREDIRLGDFDATVRTGEQLMVVSEPFCKLNEDYEPPVASPLSEQFSLGSCVYTIRFGYKPFHDLDAPVRVRRLIMNEFPSTSADILFGEITRRCWHGVYESIGAVEQDILSQLGRSPAVGIHPKNMMLGQIGDIESLMLLAECEEFLAQESVKAKNGIYADMK